MSLNIFLPTAGIGSRLGNLSKFKNKSLLTISNKPIISHIIENFPKNSHFVISLGYKGNLIKNYLKIAHPKVKITYVKIKNFSGINSGLGYTLNQSRKYLQKSFIFCSCDTLVKNKIPKISENWLGYSKKKVNKSDFRCLSINKKKYVSKILEKNNHSKKDLPYIGLANIKDYKAFWYQFDKNFSLSLKKGEVVSINNNLSKDFKALEFDWYDTGNQKNYIEAYKNLNVDKYNILPKENEDIWFVSGKVIKFSNNKNFIKNRFLRSKYIKGFVPKTKLSGSYLYFYPFVKGHIFSKKITPSNFKDLLRFSKNFWKIKKLNNKEKKHFKKICLNFYKDKTIKRVKMFFKNENIKDKADIINGIKIPSLQNLLKKINWLKLSEGIPSRFHGDFHFENIVMENKKKFKFLDWRQDFGGFIKYGDVYYDLSKLFHGIIVNHKVVLDKKFSIIKKGNKIKLRIDRIKNYKSIIKYFFYWLKINNFSIEKVNLITSLIFLNIAPLHHKPYNKFLFFLGKLMLFKYIKMYEKKN